MTDPTTDAPIAPRLTGAVAVRRLTRAIVAGIAGALAGVGGLALGAAQRPGVAIDPSWDLSRHASGIYPGEHAPDGWFAWTSELTTIRLAGLDRRVDWRCTVRVRGGRPDGIEQPAVTVAIDGAVRAAQRVTNEFQALDVVAPARPMPGLTLTLVSTPTFVPGPGDRRELGAQISTVECQPADAVWVRPPRRALLTAASLGAAFGAALALIGLGLWPAVAGAVAIAAVQAIPLTHGLAPFADEYLSRALRLGLWCAGSGALAALAAERLMSTPLSSAARFVIAVATGALFLQLLGLLHPSKPLVDAVFHAHRLQWVLGGRYFFTQPLPSGVQFPYAIGLYVFAMPWSSITRDHVTLLRVIVCAAHALSGALLYLAVIRSWNDRLAGAAAVVLFLLAPLPFIVIGNANLTYAFGQSMATLTLLAAVIWPLRTIAERIGFFLLASLALLSHVGLVPLLLVAIAVVAILYRWRGGPSLRRPARWLLLTTLAAAVFSVAIYYAQFPEAYRSLAQVRAQTATATADRPSGSNRDPAAAAPSLPAHATRTGTLTARAVGWPMLVLAALGVWRLRTMGRTPLQLMLIALAAVYAVFVGFRLLFPVEAAFQRYADEFVDRVNYAMLPGAALLAGLGVAAAWRGGGWTRVAGVALAGAACLTGASYWLAWLVD